LTVKTLASF